MTLLKLWFGAPLGAFCSKEFCSVLEPGDMVLPLGEMP
ncbi:MAG: hypothetical protein Ct9H90mP2_00950 [Dehalococcoidia bacterium]|nr:MAG: hypothetical protein Ct9H90mP2_00950 [Dehalococcoidia bacterium]